MAGLTRILVVEDDPEVRGAIRMVLEAEAYEVVESGDGAEALAKLRGDPPPSVILLDLMMPGGARTASGPWARRRHPQVANLDDLESRTGPESAHILTNTGRAPLRYLCFSTLHTTEVVGYPDSKKIGVMAGSSYGAAMKGRTWVRHLSFESAAAGYFDGEDVG